jgi:DNA-binding transcriptional MerR regulator
MKIGEVAERTQVAPRLIRYYEQQGLLDADRAHNGYRTYGDAHVERVKRIAGLVQAGIPTRLVKVLLDAEDAAARDEPTCPAEVAEQLAAELGPLESRIACLTRSRDTIRSYLERTRHQVLLQD